MVSRHVVLAVAAALAAPIPAVHAQAFPNKPVVVILPFPAGTGPDSAMRMVGEKLTKYWGQQVVVDNKPGGNGWIAMQAAQRAAPDGYTFVLVDTPVMALQPHLYKKLPYSPAAFEPVATLYRTFYFVAVAADSKWKDVGDLVEAARAKPGAITYGSSGNGGNIHLGGAMLETATNTKMTHVPYKETSQIYMDVSKGDVDWAVGTASTTAAMLKAGKVKYLAITSPQRQPSFADVPTVAESRGPANYELKTWIAMFAPRGTPKAIVDKVNADVAKVLREPDVQSRMGTVGFDPLVQTPAELQSAMAADSETYKRLVTRLNISLD